MTLWLAWWSLDQVVQAQGLAGAIELCSWTRHLPKTVPLSTKVYKWVPANYFNTGG